MWRNFFFSADLIAPTATILISRLKFDSRVLKMWLCCYFISSPIFLSLQGWLLSNHSQFRQMGVHRKLIETWPIEKSNETWNRAQDTRCLIVYTDATDFFTQSHIWFLHIFFYIDFFFSFFRISGYFLLVLALVALTASATSALKQQHPAIRTGFRSGFRRSSSWVSAAANDADDVTSQGRDETSRAIQGKSFNP